MNRLVLGGLAFALAVGTGSGAALAAPPSSPSATVPVLPASGASPGGFLSFRVAAQAPAWQLTYDFTSAPFHPLAEGDLTYTMATLDPSHGTATASIAWPGSAGANAGSLLGVLGAPTIAALNDPVKAQVGSGQGPQETTLTGPTGTTMSASVKPPGPGRQRAAAETSAAQGALGPMGTVGGSVSQSTITMEESTAKLIATATSTAEHLSLGVVTIGSATSTAQGVSVSGARPTMSGGSTFSDLQVAGQQAYVDATGVHLGGPGKPAPSPIVAMVDKALIQSGMSIYSTAPAQVTIGGVSYYYAPSIMLYWVVPQDSNGDSFTVTVGGAAVAMQVSPEGVTRTGDGVTAPSSDTGSGTATTPGPVVVPIPRSLAQPRLSLPTIRATGAAPAAAGAQPQATGATQAQAVTAVPSGIGGWWFLLLALGAIVGAVLLPRAPARLGAAASPACDRETIPPEKRG